MNKTWRTGPTGFTGFTGPSGHTGLSPEEWNRLGLGGKLYHVFAPLIILGLLVAVFLL